MLALPEITKLIIFDVDGTLAKAFQPELLPGVSAWFAAQRQMDNLPAIALATNQGGVAYRQHLVATAPKRAWKYPAQADVERRLAAIAQQLGIPQERIYVSFAYQFSRGQWVQTPIEAAGDPRWSRNWRKPNPGMLQQALRDTGLEPNEALMVGDTEDDRKAAVKAGVPFVWAQQFFQVPVMA